MKENSLHEQATFILMMMTRYSLTPQNETQFQRVRVQHAATTTSNLIPRRRGEGAALMSASPRS